MVPRAELHREAYLLHVALCLMHHQCGVGEPEAAAQLLQLFLQYGDMLITVLQLGMRHLF